LRASYIRRFDGGMNKTFAVEFENGRIEWKLNSKSLKVIRPLAQEFGLSVEKFLYLHTLGRLPAQLPRGNNLETAIAPAGFEVTLPKDPEMQKRIRRAARFGGHKSAKDFTWCMMSGWVDTLEEDMILSPKTGQPIGDELDDLEKFVAKHEYWPDGGRKLES
jgi:hypothetical protein